MIPMSTVTHPVFGKMKVIDHKEDIEYYNKHCGCDLINDFLTYAIDVDTWKDSNISRTDVRTVLRECVANSCAGKAMLKVITAYYIREYERIKKFCLEYESELKRFYKFSETESGKAWCLYTKRGDQVENKLNNKDTAIAIKICNAFEEESKKKEYSYIKLEKIRLCSSSLV